MTRATRTASREAVAVFDDSEKLESAVSELQSKGIDRSNLSFLAHASPTECPPGGLPRLADDPATPREAPVTDTDLRQGRVLATSLGATVVAFAPASSNLEEVFMQVTADARDNPQLIDDR